jgi:hypothetical protein
LPVWSQVNDLLAGPETVQPGAATTVELIKLSVNIVAESERPFGRGEGRIAIGSLIGLGVIARRRAAGVGGIRGKCRGRELVRVVVAVGERPFRRGERGDSGGSVVGP